MSSEPVHLERCPWPLREPMLTYHDTEWGTPVRDDVKLFEFLVLDGAQAGLNWEIILKRREGYRKAFANYDIAAVASFDAAKIEELLLDPGIIRNRRKVESAVINAQRFLEVQKEFGSFHEFFWSFVGGKTIQNHFVTGAEIPAVTPEAEAMSKALVQRGFKFVGPTICYAIMQSAGLVNDHLVSCFRHAELSK
ncbi:DNA-3-methyladenine glycosylase I [Leptolinea sp. HRD-7]|nr:DNA-3-methyladenine glycosylase I [Leptolinea sp. HRD-7]